MTDDAILLSSMIANLGINTFDPVSFCFMSLKSSSFVLFPRHFVIMQTSAPSYTPDVRLSHACTQKSFINMSDLDEL